MGLKINKNVVSIVLNNFQNDSRVLKEGLSLQKAGYDVQIVALWERGLAELDLVSSVPVHRVRLVSKEWSNNKLIQLIKYLEFLIRVISQYRKADIIHCHDLNALPAGWLIKKLFNKKATLIYDAHEYETEVNGLTGLKKKLVDWLEKSLIQNVDKMITVSDAIAKEYVALYSIEKPYLVLNCPTFKKIPPQNYFREELAIHPDQKIFLYQGRFSKGRGIEILLEAFSLFENDENVLVCMGYGSLEGLIKETEKKCSTVFFYPAVSPEVLLNYTASADYGILFYEDSCLNHRYCSPNKMFEYLMADLPVLTSNLCEMRSLVETNNLGIVAETNTVEGFVKAIEASLKLDYEQVKANVRQIKPQYCWEEQEKVLLELYEAEV